jgi:hypothetical protein
MDVIDLLQDLAFNTGHRIIKSEEATKDVWGTLLVQKKKNGYKMIFFNHKTRVALGSSENIELNLHNPESVDIIRGYLLNPATYDDVPQMFNSGAYAVNIFPILLPYPTSDYGMSPGETQYMVADFDCNSPIRVPQPPTPWYDFYFNSL